MDYATLTDNRGRKADFRNVILIMTSNAGALRIGKSLVGFGERKIQGEAIHDEVKKVFFGKLSKDGSCKISLTDETFKLKVEQNDEINQ